MPLTPRTLLLALATLLAASRGARAQCSGGNTNLLLNMTVTPTALNMGTATTAQFNAGSAQSSYSVTVNNSFLPIRWYLCTQATSANMGTVNGFTKPIADLQWSLNGTTWTSYVNGSLQPITNATSTQTVTVFVRVLLAYPNDRPQANNTAATYTGNVAFRVSR